MYGHWVLTIASSLDVMQRLGRGMSDETRARILLELLRAPGYPTELATTLGLSRTNVSNHLACLRGCGIVAATPEGRRTRYEISDPHLTKAMGLLMQTVLAVDDGLPCTAPGCDLPSCCDPETNRTRSVDE